VESPYEAGRGGAAFFWGDGAVGIVQSKKKWLNLNVFSYNLALL
jgi:hypothetical protein